MWDGYLVAFQSHPLRERRFVIMDDATDGTDTLIAPGCGFGFWHMWGVLNARGVGIHERVWCISGSTLAVVAHLCGLQVEEQLVRCTELRRHTNLLTVFRVVRRWLESELPGDCHLRCNGKMTVLLRRITPCFPVHRVSHWSSKEDLVDCLLAACSPLAFFRGVPCMDCIRYTPSPSACRAILLPSKGVFYLPTKPRAQILYNIGTRDGCKLMSVKQYEGVAHPYTHTMVP